MNILFIGKPGSGKGTIANELMELGFIQLSTGNLLRQEIVKGTNEGKKIEALLSQGKFASDETVLELVRKFLIENSTKSIIFDGFPRNIEQTKECLKRGIVFDKIFEISVNDNVLKDRIINRRVHIPSGRTYSLIKNPPKKDGFDDITGEPLTHRDDDREEVLLKRIQTYKEQTEPILSYLNSIGINYTKIDGESPIEEQVKEVKNNIQKKTVKKQI